MSQDYRKTKMGLTNKIYCGQRNSSRCRNHPLPSYSLNELREWIFSQPNFDRLYNNWVRSGYERDLVPSVDRKDDYLPYTKDNLLRLCSWGKHRLRIHEDQKNGVNNKQSRAVIQCDTFGNLVKEYYSQSQAGRENDICNSIISECCTGKRKSAGGFIWKFKPKGG